MLKSFNQFVVLSQVDTTIVKVVGTKPNNRNWFTLLPPCDELFLQHMSTNTWSENQTQFCLSCYVPSGIKNIINRKTKQSSLQTPESFLCCHEARGGCLVQLPVGSQQPLLTPASRFFIFSVFCMVLQSSLELLTLVFTPRA